ncbi:MAG: glycosyltransferase family 2 protein [bacterium]|nr:glycosyltransferase family 2 protein [bacterium]
MLSIIVVNYNSSKDVAVCLESIVQHEPKYKEYEIIIVDNNSGDPGLESLKQNFPFINLIYAPHNGGFAYGNNVGIKASSGDTMLMLNPDTYLKGNDIEKLYTRLKEDPEVHLAGPKLLGVDGGNDSYYSAKSYLTLWKVFCEQFYLYKIFKGSKLFNSYYRNYMDYEKETDVESIGGAVLMFKKEILEKTGLLDDGYFMYYEENDFCLQAVRSGCRLIYYPGSEIIHIGGVIAEASWERTTKSSMESFKYYFKKNYGLFAYYTALYFYFTGSLLRVIGFALTGSKKKNYFLLQLKYIFKKRQWVPPGK